MRKHLNQYVFSPLFWVMSLLLATLFILVVLLLTPVGPRTIAYIADSAFDELTLKGVSGSILTGLHVDEFSWDSETSILLKDIDVNINQYDIEKEKIFADKVKVRVLSVNIPNSSSENSADISSLPNFGLPINVDAALLQLDSLRITKDVPYDPGSQTLLFQIKDIQLKTAVIKDGQLNFKSLRGNPIILDQPLKINVSDGTMNMNQPHEVKTSGEIAFSHPTLGSLEGSVRLNGSLTQYIFEGNLELQQQLLGNETVKLIGRGDYKQVYFEQINLDSSHGKAKALGSVTWDPEVRWTFDIDGQNLSSKLLLPKWPAKTDASLKYTGSFIDSRVENQLDILSLNGDFRGHKLTGNGQITEREGLIRTEGMDIQLGENRIQATGAITEPINLELKINAKNIKQLLPELAGNVTGNAIIKGNYKKPEIKTKLTASNLSYGKYKQASTALVINGDLELENKALELKKLIATTDKNVFEVKGRASEPFDLKWNIDAQNLKQFSTVLAPGLSTEFSGNLKASGVLKGTIDKPQTTLKLSANNLVFNEFKQGNEALIVEGDLGLVKGILQLKALQAKSGSNSLQVTGNASEPLDLQVKINAQNLSQVSPDIAGRIQGEGKILGQYKAPIFRANITASNLQYRETRLSSNAELKLQGEMQLLDGVPMVKQLNTQIGDNRIQISGRASSPFDLKWNIDSNNLQQILPQLSGRLLVKGQLQGTVDKPLINATVDAKKVKYKEFNLDSADFTASTSNGIYRIKGNLEKFKSAEQSISAAKLELKGSIENHTLSALIDHQEAKVTLKANGSWQNQKWSGSLQTLQFSDTQVGDWKLQKPARVNLSKNAFSSDMICLNSKKTQVCSAASYSKNTGLLAKGTLRETPLALLKSFLPEDLEFNGTINGTYDIKQNNGKPKGAIKVTLPKNSFLIKGEEGAERMFTYEDAEFNATLDNRTIKAETAMKIVNRGNFSSKATIKLSPEDGKHSIDGNANFDVPNINFAQELIPRSRGLRGALNSKITFSGLLSKPQIKGKASIKNAYLRLPEAGTEITQINIDLKADKPGQAVLSGKMLMGKGVLTVSGDLNIKDIAKWKANIKLSGKNIRFMNTNEIHATMSPDLSLELSPELVSIIGKVTIPEADIRLKDIPETSIDESDDTFVVGERKPGEQVSAVKIHPKVKIELGDNVKINAFGLKAKLSGDVNVTHNRRDILANGSLRVTEGKFKAYGQDLDINNGRLIFNGSPKLVGMDIRATRTIDKQIVGVHLGGTLRSPKSKIFSDPELEESEALSFLLTGHSLSTSSGQESALLMSAVRGLGVAGSGSLIQKIGTSFGLDDVNIVSKADLRESELALGKRLGSRLYVRYLVGLFDQTQKIAIQYKINKVLSLEAQTSADDYGLDFIYEIERD